MSVDSLTRDELTYVQQRAKRTAWTTPHLVDELTGRVLLDLVRRPDLTDNHPLTQAVNMLVKSRWYDLLKQNTPVLTDNAELERHVSPTSLEDDELEWEHLREQLTVKVGERAARAAILLSRYGFDHRAIADIIGVSRFVVSRDITRVRSALSS